MAIKFQYNKTSLNNLNKQLKMRKNALPTLKNKESALRLEVRKAKEYADKLIDDLDAALKRYDSLAALWNEFEPGLIESVRMGFLSHHRSGIVFPASVELYIGADREHLKHRETISMPDGPGEHEIERLDAIFRLNETIGAFRIVARRHERMPQWCTYRGTPTVFTMADCLIVRPGVEK